MCQEEIKHEVAETKKCSVCGEVLPIDMFTRHGRGRENVCITCKRKQSGKSEALAQFTPRELIEELKARGYKGKLTYTIVKTLNI